MASHIARRRPVASSAGSPMPANPAMPHMSASPQRSSSGRHGGFGGLGRVVAQHVGSRPENAKEEIQHREVGGSGEETSYKESDNRPLNPQDLDRTVIRLETRASTSH